MYRRNHFTASGPTEKNYGHRGIRYFELNRDYSIPYLEDYTGVSEHELRTTFGKGEVIVEDNVFSSPSVDLAVSTFHSINVFIRRNAIFGDHNALHTFIKARPGFTLPSTTVIANNTVTSAASSAYIALHGILPAHSKALIQPSLLPSRITLSTVELLRLVNSF